MLRGGEDIERREEIMAAVPPSAMELLQLLKSHGISAYFVGGCVRDLLRGVEPSDYDLTGSALPEEMMALFGDKAHPTGIAHGTVTVVYKDHAYEITTMRRDGVYLDARHPESVEFTKDICEDLARRDFTVNAMALSAEGELIDPYGGEMDLAAGILRCVGEPERRFREDALRILRLLRFSATLGFAVEKSTAEAAKELAPLLGKIASERIYEELRKLLCGNNVTQVLLEYASIFAVLMPPIAPCIGFSQRNFHHCFDVWEHTAHSVGAVPPKEVLRWTMLFHDLGKPDTFTVDEEGTGHYYGHTACSAQHAEKIMENLRFDRATAAAVRRQLACFDNVFPPVRSEVHREMARLGRETMGLLLETKLADNAAKAPEGLERAQAPWLKARELYCELCEEGACCSVGELKINGDMLSAIGYRGREIGAVLERLLEEVSLERLSNDEAALKQRAQRLWRSGWRGTNKE